MPQQLSIAYKVMCAACFWGLLSSCGPVFDAQTSVNPTTSSQRQLPTVQGSTPTPAVLDLREANVLNVAFENLGGGAYRFDVTLLHDDDGEAPEYADAWHVEDTNGVILGTRVLTHSHGSQPFTRSATVRVPMDLSVVIVRGHDMRHGFGGQALEVDLTSGAVRVIR